MYKVVPGCNQTYKVVTRLSEALGMSAPLIIKIVTTI